MNDVTLKELKIVVERTVRPLRATILRKRKMREELLAHLTAIFEEELARLGDEHAAVDQAKRRFGDPRELSGQIQETIPRWERLYAFGDRCFQYQPGESVFVHALKVAGTMSTWFAMTTLLFPPIFWIRGRLEELGLLTYTFLLIAACFGSLIFVMMLLGHGIKRALFSNGPLSYMRATICLLLSAVVVPVVGFLLVWAVTRDSTAGYAQFRSLLWTVPTIPAVLLAALWQINRDYNDEWASLEIGE